MSSSISIPVTLYPKDAIYVDNTPVPDPDSINFFLLLLFLLFLSFFSFLTYFQFL